MYARRWRRGGSCHSHELGLALRGRIASSEWPGEWEMPGVEALAMPHLSFLPPQAS